MPMTPSADMIGVACVDCGSQATHNYSWGPICCDCHISWAGKMLKKEKEEYLLFPPSPSEMISLDDPQILSDEDKEVLESLNDCFCGDDCFVYYERTAEEGGSYEECTKCGKRFYGEYEGL